MVVKSFPNVDLAGPEGLLAIGGDLDLATLKLAYRNGIFPWPTEEFPLLWFAPPMRSVLFFDEIKIPKRYQRERKQFNFHFKWDSDFEAVIRHCANGKTRRSSGTWITEDIILAYLRFHEAGLAHSLECYNEREELVGGMYGVSMGKMFAGESMFYHQSGASKETLLYACEDLARRGATWLDVQMTSPLLESFGAKEIPRSDFMNLLKGALRQPELFSSPSKGRLTPHPPRA